MAQKKLILETERLLLRPWKKNKSDARELYRYAKDMRVGPMAGWPVHRDIAQSLEIIRTVLDTPDIYAIVLKETGLPIGSAGLTYGSTGRKWLKENEAELGYWLGVPFWGKGYAAEAARCLIGRAFNGLGMHLLWCGCYEGNERSKRLQERLGFVYHHTDERTFCAPLGEYRAEHFSVLTKESWGEAGGLPEGL